MAQKNTVILLLKLLIGLQLLAQNSSVQPVRRMEHRADSTANIIDNLITSGKVLHYVFESKQEGDTAKSYRHYFIDTAHGYLVKAIIDTTFQDHYKRAYKQTIIYFNQGYEFKSCYNETTGAALSICSYYNIYPEENEIAAQLGKLNKGWNRTTVDELIKRHVRDEIYWMKFMQKKNSNND